jgi:hypothetical protein
VGALLPKLSAIASMKRVQMVPARCNAAAVITK